MKFCPKCAKEYADNVESCSVDGAALIAGNRNADTQTGRTFAGRYQIVEKIGQGGMGAVYKAVHTRMNRVCAIKVLAADQGEGQSAVERFNREAQMASRIDNPHAVVIYDFGETEDGVLYIVMEYVEGESLGRALLREGTFVPARSCAIARQIADALGAAHALGIVHRDLKPDNVMLSSREAGTDYVKVLDFGIAKAVSHDAAEDLTRTGFVLGTPAYMSPEQLSGEKLDPRSDLYSLALLVYQMLSGKLPFEGENTQARLIKRLIDSPVPLRTNAPSVSAELEAAVMSGLARNRDDRPASAAVFANSLEACAGSGALGGRITVPVSGSPPGPVTTAAPVQTKPQGGDTAPQSGATGEDSLPTVPIGARVTSSNDSGTQAYDPPESYVTQQSTTPMVSESRGGQMSPRQPTLVPKQSARAQTDQRPLDQAGEIVPETVAVASGVASTRVGRAPMAQAGPTTSQQAQKAGRKKAAIGVVIAVIGLAILVAGVGGVFVYLKYFRNAATEEPGTSRVPGVSPRPTVGGPATAPPVETVPATTQPPLAGTGPSAEAAEHFAAGKRHQEQARMLSQSGSASEAGEEFRKAIAEYKDVIKLQPMHPEAHENLGVALYDSGRVQDAADEYKIAIDQYSTVQKAPTAQVMVNYGLALFDSKRYNEAAGAFGRALQIDPGDHDLYAHRGFALQNAGDLESARRDYRQYLVMEPSGQYASAIKQILAGQAGPPSQTGNR